jgi:hypothetical protein
MAIAADSRFSISNCERRFIQIHVCIAYLTGFISNVDKSVDRPDHNPLFSKY